MVDPAAPRFMTRRAFADAGLHFCYGFHDSPLGGVIALAADGALAGFGFADARETALADMTRRWPSAHFTEDATETAPLVAALFARKNPPLLLIGSDFELEVWRALLAIPEGQLTTYGALAERLGRPKAARAVGAAVGRNPIGVAVPCHRVTGKNGALTGYHWGLARKHALLGMERNTHL